MEITFLFLRDAQGRYWTGQGWSPDYHSAYRFRKADASDPINRAIFMLLWAVSKHCGLKFYTETRREIAAERSDP